MVAITKIQITPMFHSPHHQQLCGNIQQRLSPFWLPTLLHHSFKYFFFDFLKWFNQPRPNRYWFVSAILFQTTLMHFCLVIVWLNGIKCTRHKLYKITKTIVCFYIFSTFFSFSLTKVGWSVIGLTFSPKKKKAKKKL